MPRRTRRREFLALASATATAGCSDLLTSGGTTTTSGPTDISLSLPASVDGSAVTVDGRLTAKSSGAPVSDETVTLYDVDSGLLGNDDPLGWGLVDPFDTADNPLVEATTDSNGEFSLGWEARRVGDSRDVETYVAFGGNDRYEPTRTPADHPYPIRVDPEVVAYDYVLEYFLPEGVLVQGQPATAYVYVETREQFVADPMDSVPPVSLRVSGLPGDGYALSSAEEKPITALGGIGIPNHTNGFLAELDLATGRLDRREYAVQVAGESVTIDRSVDLGAIQVVPRNERGLRHHVYDLYGRMVQPYWWLSSGTIVAIEVGTTDPGEEALSTVRGVIDDLSDDAGPMAIAKQSFGLLLDEFVSVFPALLRAQKYQSVAALLRTGADRANVTPPELRQTLRSVHERLQAGDRAGTATAIDDARESVQAWHGQVETIQTDATAPKQLTLSVLEGLDRFLAGERERLRGASTDVESEWPMYQYDARNTGHVPETVRIGSDVEEAWRFETDDRVVGAPAVVDGVAYVGTWDNNDGGTAEIRAIRADDGADVWHVQTDDHYTWATPAVADGTVVVGTGNEGFVYALDATDGTQKWVWDGPRGSASGNPVVVDGTVYLGRSALDLASGEVLWGHDAGVESSAAVADDTVYTHDGRLLYALAAASGEERWRARRNRPYTFSTATTVANGVVLVGSSDFEKGTYAGEIRAFDAETGEPLWTTTVDDRVYGPLAVGDGTVYAGTLRGAVVAVDVATGDESWRHETNRTVKGLVLTTDRLYVGSDGVRALRPSDGHQLWQTGTGSAIALTGDTLLSGVETFDGTDGGGVVALADAEEPDVSVIDSLPVTITEPGRYELGSDLQTGQEGVAVHVRTDDVVLDGNGHTLWGPGAADSVGVLVYAGEPGEAPPGDAPLRNVTVRNVTVADFEDGVRVGDPSGSDTRAHVANVTVRENLNEGLALTEVDGGVVEGVAAIRNEFGVTLWEASGVTARDLTVAENDRVGLYLAQAVSDVTLRGVTATENGNGRGLASGVYFSTDVGENRLLDARAAENDGAGVRFADSYRNVVRDVVAEGNSGPGVLGTPAHGDRLRSVTVRDNGGPALSQPEGSLRASSLNLGDVATLDFAEEPVSLDLVTDRELLGTFPGTPAVDVGVDVRNLEREATVSFPGVSGDLALWRYDGTEWSRVPESSVRDGGASGTVSADGVVLPGNQ